MHILHRRMNCSVFCFLVVGHIIKDVLKRILIGLQPSFPDKYKSQVSIGSLQRFCATGNTNNLYTAGSFR